MLSMTPVGANCLYEITDISYGPKADNNEQTLKVTFKVTNKGNAPEFGGFYPRPYQNNEQLGSPNFFRTPEPDDFEYVPGVVDVPAGQSVEYVAYWVISNKRDPSSSVTRTGLFSRARVRITKSGPGSRSNLLIRRRARIGSELCIGIVRGLLARESSLLTSE